MALCFISCSSPESNGKKAKQKYCNCLNIEEDILSKEIKKIVEAFEESEQSKESHEDFIKRISAAEKKRWDIERKCLQKAEKVGEQYHTNEQKKSEFQYAFDNYYCE